MRILGFLFSLIGVWAIRIISTIIAFVLTYKILRNTSATFKVIKISMVVIGFFAVFLLSKPLLLGAYSSQSKVDITPLYTLSEITFIDSEDMDKIISAIEIHEGYSAVQFETGAFNIYTFGWHGDKNTWEPGGVSIKFRYFSSIEDAKSLYESDEDPSIQTKLSNYIEANLYNSVMPRSSDSFYIANWQKQVSTNILIANLMIIFHEQGGFSDIGRWTSQSIEVLCDIIRDVILAKE